MNDPVARAGQPSVQILVELRRRIAAGELAPGDRLPSTRQLTRDWGVAMATATKVLTTLRQEGLVHAVPGVGTVVTPPPPGVTPEPAPRHNRDRRTDGPLTRERIVATALRIADTHGMAEVSMRRVATELGVATMALYRYVPSKDALVLLMIEEVFAALPLPVPRPGTGWRERLDQLCRLQWAGYRQHPWLASALSFSRPQVVPRAMRHTEYAMASVSDLGLDAGTILHIAVTLALHVRSVALAFEEEIRAQQDTGLTAQEWMDSQEHLYEPIVASGDYPTFERVAALPGDVFNLESLFEFGLGRLLDGIAALIPEGQPEGAQS